MNQTMRIWIDGDGCPVVELTIKLAKKNGLPVTVVKNHAVVIESTYADVISVDISRDSADYYIANHISTGDLVITQDYGLAAMVLAKRGYCLTQNGREITAMNIDFLLDSRHQSREARMQGKRGPKHKKRSEADNEDFSEAFEAFVNRLKRESSL